MKNRAKPGDTSSFKLPRKPLRKAFPRDAAKARFTSAKQPTGTREDGRLGLSKRPLNPRTASRNAQPLKGNDRRSGLPKRPFNQRGNSTKAPRTSGNAKRSSFSRRPLSSRGASERVQTTKGGGRAFAFPKRSSKPGVASAKGHTRKGPGLFDKPCRANFPVPVGLFAEVKRGFAASRGKAFLNGFRGSLEEEVSLGLTRFFKYGLGRGDRGVSPVVDR